jgi:hypothetical protein
LPGAIANEILYDATQGSEFVAQARSGATCGMNTKKIDVR